MQRQHSNQITGLTEQIVMQTGLMPRFACELECYLEGEHPQKLEFLQSTLLNETLPVWEITKESGTDQFEIVIEDAELEPLETAETIETIRNLITNEARKQGLTARFDALPYPNQPGCGMHINISLHDSSGENILYKKEDEMCDPLRWALGGLLTTMAEHMPDFAPSEASRARYIPESNAPTHICWGANNRTTALRLPASLSGIKHIEHRVPGADANPAAVIAAILHGLHKGLTEQIDPGPQIHGNAWLEQYDLPALIDEK